MCAWPPLVRPADHWTMWIWYIEKRIYLPVWLTVKANQTAHSWYLLNLLFMHFQRTSCLPRCTQCLCLFIFCTLHRKSCYNSTARKLLTLTQGYLAVIVTISDSNFEQLLFLNEYHQYKHMVEFFRSAEWFRTLLPLSSSSEPPAPFLCSSSVAQFFQRQVKLSKFNSSSVRWKF